MSCGCRFAYDGVGARPPPLVILGIFKNCGIVVSVTGDVDADDEFDERPMGSSPSG